MNDRSLLWLGDYSYFKPNVETLPVACLSLMQYGCTIDRLLHKIVFSDPALGPVYMLKTDVSDGFYGIGIRPEDAPKLGLILLSGANEEPIVATPITLRLGWETSPPLFCADTETEADLENEFLRSHQPSRPHKLDNRSEAISPPLAPPLAKGHTQLTSNPYPRRPKAKLLAYVDVFVDDFLGLA